MSEPRWLDEREERAWRGLMRMSNQLTGHLNRQLQRATGLSLADYEVLVHLSESPAGRVRPYELGRTMQWEKSRLSHHLTRMERRGLVRREQCPDDARGSFVVLTETGRAAIEEAAPLHLEQVRDAFIDVLTPSQLQALDAVSNAVLSGLAGHEDDVCDDDLAETRRAEAPT
jgi:DNA-binding MarR family transcriptional regulator